MQQKIEKIQRENNPEEQETPKKEINGSSGWFRNNNVYQFSNLEVTINFETYTNY